MEIVPSEHFTQLWAITIWNGPWLPWLLMALPKHPHKCWSRKNAVFTGRWQHPTHMFWCFDVSSGTPVAIQRPSRLAVSSFQPLGGPCGLKKTKKTSATDGQCAYNVWQSLHLPVLELGLGTPLRSPSSNLWITIVWFSTRGTGLQWTSAVHAVERLWPDINQWVS